MLNHDAPYRNDLADEAAHAVYLREEHACAGDCGAVTTRDTVDAQDTPEGIYCPACSRQLASALLDGVIGRAHYSRRAVEAVLRGESRDPDSIDVAASARACAAYTSELVEAAPRTVA